MIFLSGLPRSGSTLLASLLSQRPDTFVSATSGLCDRMGKALHDFQTHPGTKASGDGDPKSLLLGIANAHYSSRNEPIIIDKSRGWMAPETIHTLKKLYSDVKIICPVRPIAECLASFVKIAKPDNVELFCKKGHLAQHLFASYRSMKEGYAAYPECFHFVEYDELVKDMSGTLTKIEAKLKLKPFVYLSTGLKQVQEDDSVWGIKNLHKVRPTVTKRKFSRKKLLGEKLWSYYQGGSFWSDKPEPKRVKQPIALQHELLMAGKFEESKEMCYRLHKQYPDDNDIAFNAGWFKLSDGEIKEGYQLLDRGRVETTWGDPHIGSVQPIWNGQQESTVLLRLERGLGDQIHQVRYAQEIAALGNVVIVSCSPELAPLIKTVKGVTAVVQHDAALGVYHDYWFPAMSFPSIMPEFISGEAYIPKPDVEIVKGRIGLRWQGNPAYEHSTKRLFPAEAFFNWAVNPISEFISLQKGEGEQHCPAWVEKVPLESWVDTWKAIASCEKVITSCTAVAHLAGAMGVPTEIIIPHVPYYLWAEPGNKTRYYDSVKLRRQTKPNSWEEVFRDAA